MVITTISWQKGVNALRPASWKVGELAKQTGLSVRTLHYYDEIGLLSPSRRTGAGHRLYTAGDIIYLQQIKSLRHLGFTLKEIRDYLNRSDFSPHQVIQHHIARLGERIELHQKLCDHLEAISAQLCSAEKVSAKEFIQTAMEVISVSERLEKYYTPEQLRELEERRRTLGEERIRQAEAEWSELIEQVRAEMDKGTDPVNERVQLLAERWMELVHKFTGGNPEIEESLRTMYRQETTIHSMETRSMREMMEYISEAMVASKKPE